MTRGRPQLSQQMTTTLVAAVIVVLIAGLLFRAWAVGLITFVLLVGSTWIADRRRRRRWP